MSCPTHGPLVGGYVLGALDPREMEEMRAHVAECPHCGPEARELESLPGLLDRIEPADVPPPALPPEVEEAVLDRFARERRTHRAPRRRWRRPGRAIAAAAAACAVALALALALLWPAGDDGGGSAAYASVSLDALAAAPPDAGASADLAASPAGTKVSLRAWKLHGAEYELWCIRADGRWVSGGTFWAGRDGRAEADLTAAVRPGDYHTMVVTKSTAGEERGAEVLRGELRY